MESIKDAAAAVDELVNTLGEAPMLALQGVVLRSFKSDPYRYILPDPIKCLVNLAER